MFKVSEYKSNVNVFCFLDHKLPPDIGEHASMIAGGVMVLLVVVVVVVVVASVVVLAVVFRKGKSVERNKSLVLCLVTSHVFLNIS